MKKIFLFLITTLSLMIHAQNTMEPVLTGKMAAKIIQAASAQAEQDGLFVNPMSRI